MFYAISCNKVIKRIDVSKIRITNPYRKKENNFLRKVINTFQKTFEKFIHWICIKFSISEEDKLIMNFELENDTYIDPVKQIKHEEELEFDIF